jgi:hypothetical protein
VRSLHRSGNSGALPRYVCVCMLANRAIATQLVLLCVSVVVCIQLCGTAQLWGDHSAGWYDSSIATLDAAFFEASIETCMRNLTNAHAAFVAAHLNGCAEVAAALLVGVHELAPVVPFVAVLHNTALRDRHWERLAALLSVDLDKLRGQLTCREVSTMSLARLIEGVKAVRICARAASVVGH